MWCLFKTLWWKRCELRFLIFSFFLRIRTPFGEILTIFHFFWMFEFFIVGPVWTGFCWDWCNKMKSFENCTTLSLNSLRWWFFCVNVLVGILVFWEFCLTVFCVFFCLQLRLATNNFTEDAWWAFVGTIQENPKVTTGATFYNYTSRAKKWLMVHKGVEINRNVLTNSGKQIVRGTWGYKGLSTRFFLVFVSFFFVCGGKDLKIRRMGYFFVIFWSFFLVIFCDFLVIFGSFLVVF